MSEGLHIGDCREVLPTLAADSFDSCVTDPPYGLSFMGRDWDRGVPGEHFWREVIRVLKPGAHLLAFGGTRTFHRLACAIEDAGFEVRDCIGWIYGSGFPKSMDVSKAIDKAGGDALAWRAFSEAYAAAVSASPMTHADIDRSLGIKSSSCYWARTDHRGGMPPRHHWEAVRDLLSLPEEFARLYDEAEREVIGHRDRGLAPGTNAVYGEYSGDTRITAPATDAARQWQGWGTALKPAWEPIIVARKPLAATVAENVLRYGTGAMNIDGCRVGDAVESWPKSRSYAPGQRQPGGKGDTQPTGDAPAGRWPANLIHDGSEEVVALFPSEAGAAAPVTVRNADKFRTSYGAFKGDRDEAGSTFRGDTGSAARFFYCAKASREDREEGCEHLPPRSAGEATGGREEGSAGLNSPRAGASRTSGARNHHPTVKPTDLMRYLCRLVTPPGGHVLDPFAGSGSTLKAARLEGFKATGIELSPEYVRIAEARTRGQVGLAV